MNELILELADRAFLENAERIGIVSIPDQFCIAFAQLVIQECADFVDQALSEGGVDGRALKQHFGVEHD